MKRLNKSLSGFRTVRAVVIGLVIGLLLGLAVDYFTTPQVGPSSVFQFTDRFGRPTATRLEGHVPACVVLPLLGAHLGLFWVAFREMFRGKSAQ
jgi:hypothetical protein